MSSEEEKSAQVIIDMLNQIVEEIGPEHMTSLLKAAKHKAHEAKYLGRCKNLKEAEAHIIGCGQCVSNMMPLESYWVMSHEVSDMQCELPLHTADRFQKN